VRYGGYFLSQEGCQKKINEMYRPEYEGKMYFQGWCVDIEVEKVDKKYLPKII
jgi:hypothetical protein